MVSWCGAAYSANTDFTTLDENGCDERGGHTTVVPELLTSNKTLLLHLGPPSLLPVPTGLYLIYTSIQFYLSTFLGLCYVPSAASPTNPLPSTSLSHALTLASQLAKVDI